MKLWLLRPVDDRPEWEDWYDKAFGFVIAADSELDARQMADANSGDETRHERYYSNPAHPWLDTAASTCEELIAGDTAREVMRDFHAT